MLSASSREKLLAFRKLFGAKALYFKRAQPKLPQDNELSPRRKTPLSREIVIIRELFTASHSTLNSPLFLLVWFGQGFCRGEHWLILRHAYSRHCKSQEHLTI